MTGYLAPGTWHAHPGSIHVRGTRGALRILHYANALFLFDADGVRQVPIPDSAAPHHFMAQIEAVAASLRDGRPPDVDAGEGLADLKILLALYEDENRHAEKLERKGSSL